MIVTDRPCRITLAITGASGAPYALRLLECLLHAGCEVSLLVSSAGRQVVEQECDLHLPGRPADLRRVLQERLPSGAGQLKVYGREEWNAPVASGSAAPPVMVVCPCSMGTLSAIAHGASDTLIERAADVVLKERGKLILVPRETPFSTLHLENMARLSGYGAVILPPSPGFYHRPAEIGDLIDFIVARILDHAGVAHELVPRWGYAGGGKAPENQRR